MPIDVEGRAREIAVSHLCCHSRANVPPVAAILALVRAAVEEEREAKQTRHTSLMCNSLRAWRNAIVEQHSQDEGWRGQIRSIDNTFGMIQKSSLLARLVYCGEAVRTEKCPIHKGQWSGIGACEYGCGQTGWIPNDAARRSGGAK